MNKNIEIRILTPNNTVHVGRQVFEILKERYSNCYLEITSNTPLYSDNILYIIITPIVYSHFPKYYIAFNLEQSVSKHWFKEKFLKILREAIAVLDYSQTNILFLKNRCPNIDIRYLPVQFIKYPEADFCLKNANAMFYGIPSCLRRKFLIHKILKKTKLDIICDVYGDEMNALLDFKGDVEWLNF